ncbi:MAG: glycosyl hydrolase family 18 protein [bacterium]
MSRFYVNLFVMMIFSYYLLNAQNSTSIHEQEKLLYGLNDTKPLDSEISGTQIIPLKENPSKALNGAIFGYLPDWEYLNGAQNYFKYDLLTHIACFDFAASTTGSISNPSSWPWTGLINTAHNKGVKIIMCITNFSGDEIHTIITNSTVKAAFFTNVVAKIQTYNMDGVNIDFESLNSADRGTVINTFMTELTSYVKTNLSTEKEVSFAGPAVNWSGWNLAGLANSCDYIFIMGYDFFGSWSSTSGPSAPLTGGNYNITNTVLSQYAAVVNTNPQKLILGCPYFGAHFVTETEVPGSTVISYSSSPRFSSTFPASSTYGYIWNTTYKVPWYKYPESTNWHQVWFDDDSSLGLKYDLAISKNLKGIGMWALGYDTGRQELWNLISEKYGNSIAITPAAPNWTLIKNLTETSIKIKCEMPNYASGIRVFFGTDRINYNDSLNFMSGDFEITGLTTNQTYYIKLKAFNSTGISVFTEVFAACPKTNLAAILIVNGFDRIIQNDNTRDYIKIYADAIEGSDLSYNYDCANNEAVYLNEINLNDYLAVVWILGEESTSDETFNSMEQDKLKEYLNNGKNLLVSGAEIGWDIGRTGTSSTTDLDFYNNYLRATYVADAPMGSSSTYYNITPEADNFLSKLGSFNYDDGTFGSYNTEWPDAIKPNNSRLLYSYTGVEASTYGGAGVYLETPYRLIHLSFPLETVYPKNVRDSLIVEMLTWLIVHSGVNENNAIPNKFELSQNYPNPFNPSTTINYQLSQNSSVTLKIYDVLGKEIAVLVDKNQNAGKYSISFDGSKLSSGLYIAKIDAGNFTKAIKMSLIK